MLTLPLQTGAKLLMILYNFGKICYGDHEFCFRARDRVYTRESVQVKIFFH